jgi:hypothetical protein
MQKEYFDHQPKNYIFWSSRGCIFIETFMERLRAQNTYAGGGYRFDFGVTKGEGCQKSR